jgi:hypothetical protein
MAHLAAIWQARFVLPAPPSPQISRQPICWKVSPNTWPVSSGTNKLLTDFATGTNSCDAGYVAGRIARRLGACT